MISGIEKSYDLTSVAQAQATIDSLHHNPFEQQALEMFAAKFSAKEDLLCDLGCGPGQVARFFHDRGFQIIGVDLSAGMLKQARKFHPNIRFLKANMRKLPFRNGELAGVIGFYSLCHIPRWEIPAVLTELKRVLRPSGLILLAFHLGRGTYFRTESFGKAVSLQTTNLLNLELQDYLTTAGFLVGGATEKAPEGSFGPRGYIWASNPDESSRATLSLRNAVLIGSAKDVEAVLSTGISPNTIMDGFTALHLAAGDGRIPVMKVLLRAGAEVDIRCWGGGTPLYVAVQMGQLVAARRLVEAGADPISTDHQGNTLLHVACFNGRVDIARWLLQRGVDPQAKNKLDETPAAWADRSGCETLTRILS